ncbi:acyl-CoA dehydrogenase family protein [Yinghuangia seranimata]|uniref:acyl-CoA dehydrogenase family protein n=1 Tax=Yinghuangia seranimata TaxID=408067 RepID=UPI00248C870C|nr:acyl-CoA dehydrogenase family protein [Yinghuangia seranimata]MDI2130397.1 acyl-CoA dehydrogenase family protein [Yinghuangia seranimata]
MDFNLTEDQQALAGLAGEIFEARSTHDRMKQLKAAGQEFDADLWRDVVAAGLMGAVIDEKHDGGGLGTVGLALLLEQQGRFTAQVPLLDTLVYGVLPLLEFAPEPVVEAQLPALLDGSRIVVGALAETGAGLPGTPKVTARETDGGYVLDGVKRSVPWAQIASGVLVTANLAGRVAVFVVDPADDGVTVEAAPTTAPWASGNVILENAPAVPVGDVADGPATAAWIVDRARVALAALQVGVCAQALTRTVEYVTTREQFGKPLSTKQGVMLRAADAYMDTEAIRVTALEAAWRMDHGEAATEQALVARWWASEGGKRAVHACQHLHGGMGSDIDHPIHRHFLWGRQIDVTLGSGIQQLAALGALFAQGATGKGAGA